MNRDRVDYIDYLKAMVIISVVLVHVGFDKVTYFSVMCMTLLYVSSGFLSADKEKPIKDLAASRFKKLILPYWYALFVYGLFEIVRAYYFGYSDYRICYPVFFSMIYGSSAKLPSLAGITDSIPDILPYPSPQNLIEVILPTNCHLWFLPVLFMGSVLFFVYKKYVKKRGLIDTAAIIILLAAAYIESMPTVVQFPFGLGRGFFACACMIAGLDLKHFSILEEGKKKSTAIIISAVITVIAYFGHGYEAAPVTSIYPLGNIWGVYLHYAGCVSATILLFSLFKMIFGRLHCKWLSDIGKNTMTIYLWHMIYLTLFGIIMVKLLGIQVEMDIFYMAFIPGNHVLVRILVTILSIAACMLPTYIKKKKSGTEDRKSIFPRRFS